MLFQKNWGKLYTVEIIDHLDAICHSASDRMVTDTSTEKEYLAFLVREAREYVVYNEWFVGLELILVQLYEIDYKLDAHYIELAHKAIDLVAVSYPQVRKQYAWLDELKKGNRADE